MQAASCGSASRYGANLRVSRCGATERPFEFGSDGMSANWDLPPDRQDTCACASPRSSPKVARIGRRGAQLPNAPQGPEPPAAAAAAAARGAGDTPHLPVSRAQARRRDRQRTPRGIPVRAGPRSCYLKFHDFPEPGRFPAFPRSSLGHRINAGQGLATHSGGRP